MELDVFASEGSRMCERYYSRWEMRGSVGVNALWREWGERNWVVPPLSLLREAMRVMIERERHCVVVVPNWAEVWLDSVLSGACWVGVLDGGEEGVVEEEEAYRGQTEIAKWRGGAVGGGWLMVEWCPKRWKMDWRRVVGEPWRERLRDMKDGVERERIVHGLCQLSCWRDTCGVWSCEAW